MNMLILVSTIFLLFFACVSFFMSMSETAITSLSKYRIRKIVAIQKSLSELFLKWLNYPQHFLTTILVGNTVANLMMGMLATYLSVTLFEKSTLKFNRSSIEFSSWIFITVSMIIFCELSPKILARSNPERISITVIRLLGIVSKILSPVTQPIIWFVNIITGGTKYIPASRVSSLTIEDLRLAVVETLKRGGIESETTDMLEGALKLAKIKVGDVMVHSSKVDTVDITLDKEEIIDRLIETGRSRVPVYSGDKNKIIGIVLLKDLISTKKETLVQFNEDIIRPIITVTPEKKVSDLLHEFQKGAAHCAVVVDSKDNFKGFITLEDILEEIVGEMLDEYDLAKRRVLRGEHKNSE
ncbi:MAG: hemolysin family protein [Elusimicrobiota bacterium]